MSNVQESFQAGKTHAEAEGKVDHAVQAVQDAAGSAADSAQQQQQSASVVLQQTGEQVKQMAQGAASAVKNAVGMGESNSGGSTTGSQ